MAVNRSFEEFIREAEDRYGKKPSYQAPVSSGRSSRQGEWGGEAYQQFLQDLEDIRSGKLSTDVNLKRVGTVPLNTGKKGEEYNPYLPTVRFNQPNQPKERSIQQQRLDAILRGDRETYAELLESETSGEKPPKSDIKPYAVSGTVGSMPAKGSKAEALENVGIKRARQYTKDRFKPGQGFTDYYSEAYGQKLQDQIRELESKGYENGIGREIRLSRADQKKLDALREDYAMWENSMYRSAQNEALSQLTPEQLRAVDEYLYIRNETGGLGFLRGNAADMRERNRRERELYQQLAAEFGGSLESILEYRGRQINEQLQEDVRNSMTQATQELPVLTDLMSVGGRIGGSIPAAAGTLAQAILNPNAHAPIDTNAPEFTLLTAANAVREERDKEIRGENPEDQTLGRILMAEGYSGVMSTLDSITSGVLGPAFGALILSSGAGADAVREYTEQGATAGQAIGAALAAGIFEYMFERVSLGEFEKLKEVDPGSWKDVIVNIVKSMGVNASEEAATELANVIYDAFLPRNISKWKTQVQKLTRELMKTGLSREEAEEQAKRIAAGEAAKQVGHAAAGGAFQGLLMGGTGSAIGYLTNRTDGSQTTAEQEPAAQQRLTLEAEQQRKSIAAGQQAVVRQLIERARAQAAENAAAEEAAEGLEITAGAEVFREEQTAEERAQAIVEEVRSADATPEEKGEMLRERVTELRAEDPLAAAAIDRMASEAYTDTRTGMTPESMQEVENLGTEIQEPVEEGRGTGRGTDLSDGSGQWNAGLGTGVQAGRMDGGAGRAAAQSRGWSQRERAKSRQNHVLALRGEKVSTKDLGIRKGTDTAYVSIAPMETWDEEMTSTADRIKRESGLDVIYVVGRMEIQRGAGKASIDGVITSNRIIIRADNLKFSVGQIADHELFHSEARKNPGMIRDLRAEIMQNHTRDEVMEIVQAYDKAYRGTYGQEDYVNRLFDEIFADAYAGMNKFGVQTSDLQENVRSGLADINRRGTAEETEETEPGIELPEEEDTGPQDDWELEEREEDDDAYSISSFFEAANLQVHMENGRLMAEDQDGNRVKRVTNRMARGSGIGAMIEYAARPDGGTISAEDAARQIRGATRLLNMMLRAQDGELVWRFAGSALFSAVKSNSDAQYGTTVDFSTVCRKTQQMMTAMSRAMMKLNRGLTKDEIVELQNDILTEHGTVNCPVCYVFSRWAGVGGVLDNMLKWQNKYGHEYDDPAKLQARIDDLKAATENKESLRDMLMRTDTMYQDLKAEQEDLEAQRQQLREKRDSLGTSKKNAEARDEIRKRIGEIDTQLSVLKDDIAEIEKDGAPELAWLTRVRQKQDYWEHGKVPTSVLFNLNDTAELSKSYPLAWGYRTSRGPSAGKAILPYSDMRLGDLVTGPKSNRATGNTTFENVENGEFDDAQLNALEDAVLRQRAQNLIGGQRYQSTSDFRYDYALDYLQSFWELQAIGGNLQTYTKIVEFAEMVAAIGGDVNLSVMPLGRGYENGVLIFSNVTGMDFDAAKKASDAYDNAQLILVGINDDHIRLALQDDRASNGYYIGMVIPYHASGASITNYISRLVKNLGEAYDPSNYKSYEPLQNDIKREDATPEQKRRADLRKALLTGLQKNADGDTVNWTPTADDLEFIRGENADISDRKFQDLRSVEMRALAGDPEAIREYESWSAGVLWNLYQKMWVDESRKDTYGVRLSTKQAEHIMPHEYWNTEVNRKKAYINGLIFRSFCYSQGLTPRFTGIKKGGTAAGYGDFSTEPGYWKLLIDRPMYTRRGEYRPQQQINVTRFSNPMLTPEYGERKWGDYKVPEPVEEIGIAAGDRFANRHATVSQGLELSTTDEDYTAYSVSDEEDEEYMELAEDPEANEEQLQEMVDRAAREAGYTVKGYHGTRSKFNVFDKSTQGKNWGGDSRLGRGFYFAHDRSTAQKWTDGKRVIDSWLSIKKPLDLRNALPDDIENAIRSRTENKLADYDESYPITYEQYKSNLERMENILLNNPASFLVEFKYDKDGKMTDGIHEFLSGLGYDGIITDDEILVFDSNQIKSADPVTYDDNGNVIPLSERFNDEDEDIRYSIAGLSAETADTALLETAKELENMGESAGDIYAQTGWFRGGDGRWRWEIDDSNMRFFPHGDARLRREDPEYVRYLDLFRQVVQDGNATEAEMEDLRDLDRKYGGETRRLAFRLNMGNATMGDVLDHPALFEAYPELEDMPFRFADMGPRTAGQFNPTTWSITLNPSVLTDTEGTLLHEIQHAIQQAEDFARGASPEYWMGKQIGNQVKLTALQVEAEDLWKEIKDLEESSGYNAYADQMKAAADCGEISVDEAYDNIQAWERENLPQLGEMYDRYWDMVYEQDDLQAKIGRTPMDLYLNTYGEQEARDAADRRTLTREQRMHTMPFAGDENTVFADSRESANAMTDEAAEVEAPALEPAGAELFDEEPPYGNAWDDRGERWTGMRYTGTEEEQDFDPTMTRADFHRMNGDLEVNAPGERTEDQILREKSGSEYTDRIRYIAKEDYDATESLNRLGVKIDGSVPVNYGMAKGLRITDAANKALLRDIRKAERRLGVTAAEKNFATAIVAGLYSEEDIPRSMRADKVMDLAQYYMDERALGENLIRAQRVEINRQLDDRMSDLFRDADADVRRQPQMIGLNHNTPQRNMRSIFGDERGEQINREVFDPVARNEAERLRWINRQFDQVRRFADSRGKQSSLTRQESALVQMVIEGRAVAEQVASMEMGSEIQAAAEDIRRGGSAADSAREHSLTVEERRIAEKYARWMEAQELLNSKKVDSVKVENAVAKYKDLFNQYYDAINDFLVVHGYEPIGFIKGYAPHMQSQESVNALSAALQAFGIKSNVTELDTGIAGRTKDFRPNKRWNPYFLSREGDSTNYDIESAFESYIDYLSDVLYHTDDIMKLRRMSRYFRQNYSGEEIRNAIEAAMGLQQASAEQKSEYLREQGVIGRDTVLSENDIAKAMDDYTEKLFEQITKTTKFGNLVMWLDNYTNILAGKQNSFDRAMEEFLGRRALNFGSRLTRAFARSNVAGNLSSVLNQTSQLPMAVAENGARNTMQAIVDILSGKAKKAGFAQESDLLSGKKGVSYLVQTPGEMITTALFTPAEFMDGLMSTIAVRGAYRRGLQQGMDHDEAMRFADQYGTELMASRLKGTKPNTFESRNFLLQAVNMFQIEALNQWEHIAKDLPRDFRRIEKVHGKRKAALALAGVIVKALLGAFVLNRITEEVYGGTPAPFDLLGLTANFIASGEGLSTNVWIRRLIDDGTEQLFNERFFDTSERDAERQFDWKNAFEDLGYNASNEVPYLRNVSGLLGWGDETLPIPDVAGGISDIKDAVANSGLGSGESLEATGLLAAQFLPGGRQATKTLQGLRTMSSGAKMKGYGSNARMQYPVANSVWNWTRALMFGNSALGETQDYYASGDRGLNKQQTQKFMELQQAGIGWNEFNAVNQVKNADGSHKDDVMRVINGLNLTSSQKDKLYYYCGYAQSRIDDAPWH